MRSLRETLRAPASGTAFLLVAALAALLYGPALSRSFVSEDFLILRTLSQGDVPGKLIAMFKGPWLGISVVKFYRPVSTAFFAGEAALFGTSAALYNIVHVSLHCVNALLVFALFKRLGSPVAFFRRPSGPESRRGPSADGARPRPDPPSDATHAALAGCALFLVYPLHPNAVIFLASFATLVGGLFVFVTLLLYIRARQSGSRRDMILSFLFFVLALGCYEQAVVAPVLLFAYDMIAVLSGRRPRDRGLRSRIFASSPVSSVSGRPTFGGDLAGPWALLIAILASYFALRHAIFGVYIGGYSEFSARLTSFDLAGFLRDGSRALTTLVFPSITTTGPRGVRLAASLALGAGVGIALLVRVLGRGLGSAALPLLSLLGIVVFQAPFGFLTVVPANGRYWYLAAFSLAGTLVSPFPWSERRRTFSWCVAGAMLIGYASLLRVNIGEHRRAADMTRTISGKLSDLGRARNESGSRTRLLIANVPRFVASERGANIAQVFHYGLADAVRPPFHSPRLELLPLLPGSERDLLPLVSRPDLGDIYRWDEARSELVPVLLAESPDAQLVRMPRLVIESPPEGAEESGLRVRFRAKEGCRHRLVVAEEINAAEVPVDERTASSIEEVDLPAEALAADRTLYCGQGSGDLEGAKGAGSRDGSDGSPGGQGRGHECVVLYWIEARDPQGRLAGWSDVRTLRLDKGAE